MKYILGIDIGTGSTKAVALNLKYEPIEVCQQHYPTESRLPGYSEQDPELIWQAFVSCIEDMIVKLGESPVAICLSSAMHSVIAVDEGCAPLSPMITWADARSADIATRIKASREGMNIYKSTGTPIHAMSPLCKLIWLNENQPDLFHRAYKFISIKEYIWYKLFKEFKVDHSIASCTGLFDLLKLNWNMEALGLASITADQLSEPVSTSYMKPGIDASITSLKRTTFVIGASDGCLANIGSNANEPGIAALTIGTSGAVRVTSKQPIFNEEAMTFSYVLDEDTYISGGPVNNGGIALQWLLKNVLGKKELSAADYTSLFDEVSTVIAGSNGLIFLPYLTGERAPIWDTSSCGTFFGLRLHHEQAHLARAVIEGICYALNDVLLAVARSSDGIKQINVSGGFVHSKIWMEILADITGKKIVLIQKEDASAIGAAYMAVKAMGYETRYPSAEPMGEAVIEPNLINHELYRSHFMIYKKLYTNLKDTMQELYHIKDTTE